MRDLYTAIIMSLTSSYAENLENLSLLIFRRWSAHHTKMLNGGYFFNRKNSFYNLIDSRYFNRDVECIRTFFKRRFRYESSLYPRFRKTLEDPDQGPGFKLDIMVQASGFGKKDMKVLEEVGCILLCFYAIH